MFPPPTKSTDPDASIRATDNDAAVARLSAVRKGYLADPYIAALIPRAHLQQPRPPLINIGTHLRAWGIDHLVDGWFRLAREGKVQIVSLGAGSDTRFWRLANGPHSTQLQRYIEFDFAENTSRKVMSIRKNRVLSAALGSEDVISVGGGGTALRTPVYNLFPVDLRAPLPSRTRPGDDDSEPEPLLSPTLPTLLLFECVLAYMSPAASNALIQWFVDYFASPRPARAESRGVSLPGAEAHPDLASLSRRFLDRGFTTARALTLREIRRGYVEPRELRRLARLEMLDEVEELELVLEHYAVSWGAKVPEEWVAHRGDGGADAWGLVAADPLGNDEDEDDGDGDGDVRGL
ncbi:S-adenosyl-L-methionine-dependent methyltransferase [Russula brevipes]|nr:S-adenosyl-L-methionine-dependent methyltransferase [Russula brevipes]